MAQGSSGRKTTGPQNKKGGSGGNSSKPTASGKGGKQQAISRKSVAQARTSNSNNRTQLIIGAVAIVVIAAIIIIGIVMNQKETAVQNEGYGASTKSVATESGGVVTVSNPTAGTTPKVIDLYEDALCPVCAEFEAQFGQQINQAVDEGKLTVNVHMLTFLDPRSFSKNYSTRAAAALLCVAQEDGSKPGCTWASTPRCSRGYPAQGGRFVGPHRPAARRPGDSKGASDAAAECITSRRTSPPRPRRTSRRRQR